MNNIDNSQRFAAKVAAISLLFSFVVVVFGNYALLNPIVVPGDATKTAQNMFAHETQVRLIIVCFLSYAASVIVVLAALYVVLKRVNPLLALLGALFRLVFATLWLLTTLNVLSALRLVHGATYLGVFESERLQSLGRFYLAANFDDYYVGLPFFGLAATICAWLWLKSNYIPRKLSIFGVIASAWCVLCAFAYLLFPAFGKPVNPYWFDSPMAIFELVVSIWLLFKGLNPQFGTIK